MLLLLQKQLQIKAVDNVNHSQSMIYDEINERQ